LGDHYGDLLNDVRGVLRTAVMRASGREIDARADEYFAVFERPAAAIEAAVAIQRALGKRVWPGELDVRVRAGIHSGRPTLTDVGYIGLAVHTTARVCSAAHGGQIVVSRDTRAAVGPSAPTGVRFRGLGRHRLPGLPDVETLFQVQAKGLRAKFPKPRIARRSAARSPVRSPSTRRS
jgi:class 3 adenylate cyclase